MEQEVTPGGAGVGMAGAAIIAGAAAFLFFGCVHVAHEPELPFPERPTIRFFRCGPQEIYLCLNEPDADQLRRFIEKLNEFDAARARLLKD